MSNYIYCIRRDLYNQRSYTFTGGWGQNYHLITLDKHKFNKEELDFIDELIQSMDRGNIDFANQIILSKYE